MSKEGKIKLLINNGNLIGLTRVAKRKCIAASANCLQPQNETFSCEFTTW